MSNTLESPMFAEDPEALFRDGLVVLERHEFIDAAVLQQELGTTSLAARFLLTLMEERGLLRPWDEGSYARVVTPEEYRVGRDRTERYALPERGAIVIRRVDTDLRGKPPTYCVEWHESLHPLKYFIPRGMAVVEVGELSVDPTEAALDYLYVIDGHRRIGLGTALVRACLQRWPRINLGRAATEEGELFLRALVERGLVPRSQVRL
jgi:GNAT superfamily N-acetyltransferase